MRVNVLDHGFIELIDSMGDEAEIARAARISYGDTSDRPWEKDAKLIAHLHANHHTSPFEMVELKWRVKLPIFVARQWIRHRTANVNEESLRYTESDLEFYYPKEWRAQDTKNRQGSDGFVTPHHEVARQYNFTVQAAAANYELMLARGVSRELARIVLPVSVYTEMVWKNDLHNTLNFLKLRGDEHAQWEIRQYAEAMITILQAKFPKLMEIVWP